MPVPPGETSGFGVEKRPLHGMRAHHLASRKRLQQILRQAGEVGDSHAAVAAMALPDSLGLEVLAMRGRHHFAAHQFLDVASRFARLGAQTEWYVLANRRRRRSGVFAVDGGHPAAQSCELFLNILHSLFLCPV